jgi:hypothetical protein
MAVAEKQHPFTFREQHPFTFRENPALWFLVLCTFRENKSKTKKNFPVTK